MVTSKTERFGFQPSSIEENKNETTETTTATIKTGHGLTNLDKDIFSSHETREKRQPSQQNLPGILLLAT